MINISYSPEIITQKRAQIRANFFEISPNIKSEKINLVNTNDLELLFGLYDSIFLKDYFTQKPLANSIRFSWSQRLTKAAGKTIFSFKKQH